MKASFKKSHFRKLRSEFIAFLYVRNWTTSVGVMAVIGSFFLFSPFQGDLGTEGQAPLPLGLELRIFTAILIPFALALFLQFWVARHFKSRYVSAVHLPVVWAAALIGYTVICFSLGTDRGLAIEELTYNCLAKPSRYCARTVRANKEYVGLFPEEQKREILQAAYSGVHERRFESLTAEKQAYVKACYQNLVLGVLTNNFPEVLRQSQNIFLYVDDFGSARSYEAIAKRELASAQDKK